MKQPELPIDPPIDTETPVDHVEVIRTLLREVDHHASLLTSSVKCRKMFEYSIDALNDMLEVMK